MFQVTTYADWVKCTKKYAEKGLTADNVVSVCDKKGFIYGCPPKCEHEALFFQGEVPCGCKKITDKVFTDGIPTLKPREETIDSSDQTQSTVEVNDGTLDALFGVNN